jgi:hypothetical protein
MAKNFLESFARNFDPVGGARLWALESIQDRNKKQEEEKERQRIEAGQKAVMDLFRGGENINIPQGITPILPQGINQKVPYTQEQQIEKIGQIFPEPSQYFNAVSKLLNQEPKQKKGIKVGDNYYEPKEGYTNVPDLERPITSIPPKDIRTEVIKATEIEGQEGFKGYVQKVKREYDTDGNVLSQELVNNPYKVTKEKTTEYGGRYTDASTDVKKELGNYRKKQQEIKARLDLVRKGVPVFEESWWGGKLTLSEDDLRNQLNQVQGEYQEYIKNTEPATVVDIRNNYIKDFGEVDPSNADDLFNYYANIYDDYRNKKIEPVEYIYLVNDFTAKYGFDPQAKFDSALNGR